jgi:Glycosyl transferases group 1
MKFIIESSSVPIYNRIATAFAQTLMAFGHTVHFIDAAGFNEADFVNTINGIEIDYYISTNELNVVQKKSEWDDSFLFEKIQTKIIFIHHDNLFSAFHSISYIANKLQALTNIGQRSYHFCLEASNVDLLKAAGIPNAAKINHASEFTTIPIVTQPQWGVTFIGHLMSSLNLYPADSVLGGQHLQVMAWNRFSQSSYAVQADIEKLTHDPYVLVSLGPDADKNLLATQQFLMAGLNKFSSPMRGQLISTIKNHRVDIFGGDLSYGRINDPLLILQQSNVHYQPATQNYQDACRIYQSSRINLNISSLQFDTAVNNRVFDVIMSGGFVLTDRRNELFNICEFANEISFETPDEMNEKISYFSNYENNKKYLELKNESLKLFSLEFSYEKRISHILNELNEMDEK